MFEAVTYATYNLLVQRVEALERDNVFLRSCLLTNQWITRKQTAIALGVSEQTVKRLQDNGRLNARRDGKKVMYEVESIRIYLTAQKIDYTEVDQRVLLACATMT